jgi:hypothetical protein
MGISLKLPGNWHVKCSYINRNITGADEKPETFSLPIPRIGAYNEKEGNTMLNAKFKALLKLQAVEFSQSNQGASKQEREKIEEKVEKLRSKITAQLLKEYDLRKQKFKGDCAVPLRSGVCSGCCISVSQRTLRLAEGRMTECEHCGRLVFNPARHKPLHVEVCAA